MKIAVVGATGLVGREMLKVLEEFGFNDCELVPAASEKSAGSVTEFAGKQFTVLTIEKALEEKPEIALFSAGGEVSRYWAPKFAEMGCYVIDNSSAWRMDADVPLVVPEINGNLLTSGQHLIANPNCSTIQLVMVIAPLHRQYGIERMVVSTYQSVSGSGQKAMNQLDDERNGLSEVRKFYPHPIDLNCIPHCDDFADLGYTKEEWKLINESKKILSDHDLKITATCVRVPVIGGHSESVNITLKKEFQLNDVYELLAKTPGVIIEDHPVVNEYPMPFRARGRNEVFAGRIRRDFTLKNSLNLWIVADNLRKGAATNAVQIASLIKRKFL
ncbi:MAG: aspartate-semialdehyde dehydrogenase [Bacteroidales bacterium]